MPYDGYGRVEQKRRTREALVAAAREVVARGQTPSVEGVAVAARVSRTTAYRYFPDQRSLLAAAHPETGRASLLDGADPSLDVAARLAVVVDRFTALIRDTEPQQRTMLRLSLESARGTPDGSLPLRQGRAIDWIAEAIDPLGDRLTPEQRHALVLAIRSAIGIEALVWLTDVGGLTPQEAGELMAWSAQSLLHAALESATPPSAIHSRGDRSP
jgi:AcrR family transcriptional regulator